MPENQNLQNEIDSILTRTNSNSNNQVIPGSTTPQTQNIQTQPNPLQTANQIPQQPMGAQQQNITDIHSINTPQITTHPTSQQNTQNSNTVQKESKPLPYLAIIGIGTVAILLVLLFLNRKSIFGPVSFTDCANLETSRIVELEPAYCMTQEGKIFYKNRSEKLPENSEYTETFDPANPPETVLPQPL